MDTTEAIALSRLMAQRNSLDVAAGNIANAGTPGFKAERMQFADYLSRQPDARTVPGGAALNFVQDRATWREWQSGTLTQTGNPLDLAITGDGWFTVQTAQGPRLTRAGHFTLGPDGTVQDMDGNALLDAAGQPLLVPQGQTRLTVAGDGTLSGEAGQIGRIGVVAPGDANLMQAEGARLMDAASTATTPVAAPRITQGAVEQSNVHPVLEMTRMMDGLRQFQFVSQFIQTESDRQLEAVQKIAQPSGS